jgi:uncharacterized protein (TIGR00369 family)
LRLAASARSTLCQRNYPPTHPQNHSACAIRIFAERIRAVFGRQGFLRHVDARIEELAPGRCVIVADFRPELAQQNGYFHGGLIGTIADAAGACAASTLIESRQWLLTAEYKVNFLSPAKAAKLKAVGEVVRAGRMLSVSQVHLYAVDEAGEEQLCALATVTLATLEGEAPVFQKD